MMHKRFPPRIGNVFVPVSSRAQAITGLALYSPSRLRGRLVQYAGYLAVFAFGPSALPGPVLSGESLLPTSNFGDVVDAWRAVAGDFDAIAVYQRPQAERDGFAVLLIKDDTAIAFAKVDADPRGLRREHEALTSAGARRSSAFSVPKTLGLQVVAGWTTLVVKPLPLRFHRSALDIDVDTTCFQIRSCLSDLPARADVPEHWQPMHGDMAPWNVRRPLRRGPGPVYIVDWEDAGWGPPHADAVYYRAACAALRSTSVEWRPEHQEARRFWLRIIRRRLGEATSARDTALAESLAAALTHGRSRG